jgi:hypothetical protein
MCILNLSVVKMGQKEEDEISERLITQIENKANVLEGWK